MLDVLGALRAAAATRPDAIAFDEPGRSITNAELAGRVGGLAKRLRTAGRIVGLHGRDGIEWLVADLAVAAAGRTAVPLPGFFSTRQIGHIIADAGVDCVLTTESGDAGHALLCGRTIETRAPPAALELPAESPARIIYTSGTTGRPKGVELEAQQIDLTCAALQTASGASAGDRHLSVLPLSTLLESICGLYLPIRVGARSMLRGASVLAGAPHEAPVRLAQTAMRENPTTTVLTPQLLGGWTAAIESGVARAPDGLRFVAVGSAAAGRPLIERAWRAGVPAYEGYGLSECCSVVALNAPGANRAGTVGRALPHVSITLDNGEIVVRSGAVMRGYVGGPPASEACRTGDLGTIDACGYITILGRKDNVIVLPNGRKLSPEWVEAEIGTDPRIALCAVYADQAQRVVAVVAWSAFGASWARRCDRDDIEAFAAERCRSLPAYARPDRVVFVDESDIRREDIFTETGKLRRAALAGRLAHRTWIEIEPAFEETHDVLRSTAR